MLNEFTYLNKNMLKTKYLLLSEFSEIFMIINIMLWKPTHNFYAKILIFSFIKTSKSHLKNKRLKILPILLLFFKMLLTIQKF